MSRTPRSTHGRWAAALATAAILVLFSAALAAASEGARADGPTCAGSGNDVPFALAVQALKAPARTDVYVTVTSTVAACPVPDVLKKVQVKALATDGSTAGVHNYTDVPSPAGVGAVAPDGLGRGQQLEVTALVQTPEAVRTYVLDTETTVRLRPDLVATVSSPSRVVRKQPFTVEASVREVAGDTGARALVSLYDGARMLSTGPVSVVAGGTATVPFASIRIPDVGTHDLVVRIGDAAPVELDTTNNSASASVAVAMYDADGAVVSENSQATKVGADVLRAGGNAIDAAAAVQWALNLAEPGNTGLGGGVNVLVHLASGQEFAIDGRETTPAAVGPDFYVTRKNYARNGFSAGVPGTLRTMDYMLGQWGTMTLAQTLQPAIDLGEQGVVVSKQLATSINNRGGLDPDTKKIFFPGGVQLREGDTYHNPDLVKTFRLIAAQGPSVFYDGEIADAIVAAQRKSFDPGMGGVMTKADVAAFQVDVSKPLSIDYRGYKVESVGPSTGGGIVIRQMLKMVERFPLGSDPNWGFQSPNASQAMLEAMRLGFADQDMWMGDNRPGFYADMPVAGLLSDDYLARRSALIDPAKRMPTALPGDPRGPTASAPPQDVEPVESVHDDSGHTSQFTIIDRWGNVVTATTTLGDGLGCTITVPGYGFVLNDASGRNLNQIPQAGKPKWVLSGAGRVQVTDPGANDAAGGKRGLGNVAPLIVLKDGEPVLATGGAGGAQIMPAVYQVVTNLLDFHKTLQQALDAPRIGGDNSTVLWNGDEPPPPAPVVYPGYPQTTLDALRALGDPVRATPSPYPFVGGTESITVDPDTYALTAAADPRGLPAVGRPIILTP
jgi:gamma-glutamyltranspeptidase / glutathione hydrolase